MEYQLMGYTGTSYDTIQIKLKPWGQAAHMFSAKNKTVKGSYAYTFLLEGPFTHTRVHAQRHDGI